MKKLMVLFVAFFLVLGGCSKDEKKPIDVTKEVKKPVVKKPVQEESEEDEADAPKGPISITTGKSLSEDFKANPFTVMIENSPAARPHTGLVSADIVYEFETEGKITRFLAVYHDHIPEKVGPVRSSRHYFVPLAESFNAPYVHFGGSALAYKTFSQLTVPRYDGISHDKYFKRDSSRKAPHNAYLIPSTLENYIKEMKSPFSFSTDKDKEIGKIHKISYNYNDYTKIEYVFDEKSKLYTRFLEGKEHADRVSGKAIKTRNIIFLTANHNSITNDPKGRIDVDTKGAGDVTLFTNGKKVSGRWEYKNGTYYYYDSQGNSLMLNPGPTWVQVIRFNQSIVTN